MTSNKADRNAELAPDPFRYGWRQVERHRTDGTLELVEQPLGPDDFLDPQPGDVMIQGALHFECVNDLYNRLALRYRDDPATAVFADMKMLWGIPGLKQPAPDIAVVPGVRDKGADRESFDVVAEGTRPCLVIEVMSRNYAGDDTKKPAIYALAGIPEYLILKPYGQHGERELSLQGFRMVRGRYQRWRPDADAWFRSDRVGVGFRVAADRRHLELVDLASGDRLPTLAELAQAREQRAAALATADAERARADAAEGELERLRARLREQGIDPG